MIRLRAAFLPLCLILAGCGAAAYQEAYSGVDEAERSGYHYDAPSREEGKRLPPAPKATPARDSAGPGDPEPVNQQGPGQKLETIVRKIVYTGRFVVDVYDIEKARSEAIAWAESLGGYMQSQQSGTVVLKIPAEHFPSVLLKLRELGRVNDELTDIRAQDVTQEYYDLELRLKTRKEYLASLSKLLEQAGKLEEKLAVQREIASVVSEIEQMEGRLRVMAHLVSFATVTVEFRPAYRGPSRTFKLPWEWLDRLGVEYLIN